MNKVNSNPATSIIRQIVDTLAAVPPTTTQEQWDDITVTAIVLGLAPLLHWQLEQQPQPVPPMAMAKLSLARQAHDRRNRDIAAQLAELLAECHRRHIPVIVLKGALLAPLAYPAAALRPMNDIDLLFQPDDLPRAAALLESLGYRGKTKAADMGPGITKHLSTYRRSGNHASTPNPYLSAGGDRMVEPHLSLEESWFGLKADITPGVWGRAVPVTLAGQPALRLSTPDLLLHLAVHATFHVIMGAAVFVQLYDIGRVIAAWPAELDWAQVQKLAGQAQAGPFLYAALYWANALYAAPVPPPVLQSLAMRCDPTLVEYIRGLTAEALFRRTQQPPLATLVQRLRRGLADRREAARWAASPAERRRIWQTALAVHKTDTAGLLLGRKMKAG